jgi:SIR2-like domain
MSGHLFVVRSDLTRLACDAWLVPSDALLSVEHPWRTALPDSISAREELQAFAPGDFGRGRNVFALPGTEGGPIPCVANIGGISLEQQPERVVEFLDIALAKVSSSRIPGRDVPLFAFPLVGTGHGGWSQAQGELTRAIVTAVSEWVGTHDADAVLVSWTSQAFAAAQSARRRLGNDHALQPQLAQLASSLGMDAARGRLVLFLGAGLGVPAGLPMWDDLLRLLAADAGVASNEVDALMGLYSLDAARIIEGRLGGDPKRLGREISRHIGGTRRFGLGHALLASLPVSEVVTTNYDTLFESAAHVAGRSFAVLPYDVPTGDGWLLKLHGCVKRGLSDIVLTRGDYLRYADRRAALAGIVQALLITREMLFVGFSLSDDNFLRIADDVRKAVRGTDRTTSRTFGTALLIEENQLLRELWADDIYCATVAPKADEGGRAIDLFLDQMLASASTGAQHLLDPEFEGALDAGEIALSGALREFERSVPAIARAAPAWAVVEDALKRLGWRERSELSD